MKLPIAIGLVAIAAPLALAQSSTWVSDPNHSEVDFAITHMSVSKVHGRFGDVHATIQYNESDISRSSVRVTVGVGTLDTGVQTRDDDVKGPRYFDVASFPSATFSSTSVTKSASGLKVAGNLTLHGVTQPIVLDVEGPTQPVTDDRGKIHRGFSATTAISRTDFAIGAKTPATMLSDDVQLTIKVDAVEQ